MAIELSWVAIVRLTMFSTVLYFQLGTLPGSCTSISRKVEEMGLKENVKHCRERIDDVAICLTSIETLREVNRHSGYQRRTVRQVKLQDQSESEKGGSRMPFWKTKVRLEFDSKREIPGGPDAQHHGRNGL